MRKNLMREIRKAKKRVDIGKEYIHYKGGIYKIINVAVNENTQDIDVLYSPTSGKYKNIMFTRPITQWNDILSYIRWDTHINGLEVIKKRFERFN